MRSLILIGLLATVSFIDVRWDPNNSEMLKVRLSTFPEEMSQCLSSGLELRVRYEVKFCSQRSFWYDRCGANTVETRSIRYDPISEQYSAIVDQFYDVLPPESLTFDEKGGAVGFISELSPVTVSSLPDYSSLRGNREYVGVRILVSCKGASGGVLEQIPWFMTFGLYDPAEVDSGWVAFNISRE